MNRVLTIAFLLRGVPCSGRTLRAKPLGGSESAMISMAEALARRGHHVTVFTEADALGTQHGVTYRSWRDCEAMTRQFTPDVFIGVRHLLPFLAGRWGRVNILWTPDAYDQPFLNAALQLRFHDAAQDFEIGLYSLGYVQRHIDAIFCVGAWQADTLRERFKLHPDKVFLAYNGIQLDAFAPRALAERRREIVYCSTPFRGLEHLLRYFPAIRARVPDATCAVFSGMQLYGASAEEDRAQFGALYALAEQPGVELVGPVAKPTLAARLCEARLLAYPNTFAETFCIAVAEAQAAGLPVVTTQLGALPERVTDGVEGYVIPGHPSSEAYRAAFVDHVVELLTDDERWERMHATIPEKIALFGVDRLAAAWEARFHLALEQQATVLRVQPRPFRPQQQECDVMVNGAPKHIVLSAELLRSQYRTALKESGFPRAAEQVG